MEVSYTLSRDDVWAFNRFHLYRKKKLLRGLELLSSVLIVVAWLFLSGNNVRHILLLQHFFGWTPLLWRMLWLTNQRRGLYWLLLTAYGVYILWGNKWLALHRAVSDKTLAEPKTIRLTDAGVEVMTPSQQSHLTWNTIREVAADRRRLYLYISPTNALVVPRRAFASPEQATAFEAAARSFQSGPYNAPTVAAPDVWPPPPSRAVPRVKLCQDDTEKDDAPGTLTVAYVTRRADLWRSTLLLVRRPTALLNLGLPWLFSATMLVFIAHLPFVPVFTVAIVLWLLMVFNWLRSVVVARLPDPKAARHCRSILRSDAFVDIFPEGQTVLPWGDVGEIFLFLGDIHIVRKGGIGSSLIPRTAFPTEHEAQEFFAAVRRLQQESQETGKCVVA